MIPLRKDWGGLKKTTCRLIVWKISFLLAFGLIVAPGRAQSAQETRVEYARVSGSEVHLQVSVPRGQNIETATLTLGGERVTLTPSPLPSSITQWLVLDQSAAVINTAPTILTAITRFLQGLPADTQTGIVLYADQVVHFSPTRSINEITAFLSGYSGRANSAGCLGSALAHVAEQVQASDSALTAPRVLLIGGAVSRQNVCAVREFEPFGVPVDVIVVADDFDEFYLDITELSGGRLLRANIQTLSARVNEVKALWANPVYLLSGSYSGQASSGSLALTLSSGATVSAPVALQHAIAPETAPVTGGLTVIEGRPAPTVAAEVVAPTETIVEVSTVVEEVRPAVIASPVPPTQEPTAPAIAQMQPTSVPPQPTTISEPAAAVITEPTSVPTEVRQNPTAAPTIEAAVAQVRADNTSPPPTAVAADADETVPSVRSAEAEGAEMSAVEPAPVEQAAQPATIAVQDTNGFIPDEYLPYVGAGGGLAFVLWGLLFIRARRSRLARERARQPISASGDHTVLDFASAPGQATTSDATVIDFGAASAPAADDDPYDTTEMFMPPEAVVPEYDDFELTEIVTAEEMLAVVRPPLALLKFEPEDQAIELRPLASVTVGRSETSDVVLSGDRQISRQHVVISAQADDTISLTLRTRNPVLLNNQPIEDSAVLAVGDVVQLSTQTRLLVLAAEASEN